MASTKITLKDYLKKKKKGTNSAKDKESKDSKISDNTFTSIGSGDGFTEPPMNESFLTELLAGITPSSFSSNVLSTSAYGKNSNNKDAGMTTYPSDGVDEEEPELQVPKVDQARMIFQQMVNRPNVSRADIINAFQEQLGTTESTSVSYYTRFLEEFGMSSKDQPESLGQGPGMGRDEQLPAQPQSQEALPVPPPEQPEQEFANPDRAGIIRVVNNAHLVFKRQSEDGTFEELWIYNIHDNAHDEMDIRRDILAGTDIPPKKTMSPDRQQHYTIKTMGNAQLLHVMGLPN